MKTQTLLLRYYKRRFYHGRSFVARAVDFLALRVITLAACYLWFTTLIDNTVMAAVLSLTAVSYTHLDVYKRQLGSSHRGCNGSARFEPLRSARDKLINFKIDVADFSA